MKPKQMIMTILFFGALWGIIEATLGYVLQFLPPYVSGAVMFPIAAMIMFAAFNQTKSASSLVLIGLVAASFKSVNFLMPGLLAVKTYNPMIAIVLQAMVVALVVGVMDKVSRPEKVGIALGLSVTWRALFTLNVWINHTLTGFPFPQIKTSSAILQFVVIDGIIAGVVLSVLVFFTYGFMKSKTLMISPKPAWTLLMVVLAVVATVLL
ncbi:MAG: hypothetical protein K9K93_05075 [Acholeplasmataceae bacterium]|nr:hypothetical protein [Acholeplasmataceae bacterium]